MIDIHSKKTKPKRITLDLDWLSRFLGIEIPRNKIIDILKSLDIKSKISNSKLQITIPTFRLDLNIPEDIAEEIARIYSYDKIKERSPIAELKPLPENKSLDLENIIKDTLSGAGYTEVYNYSFVGENLLNKTGLGINEHIKLKNPLSRDLAYLRMDLVPRMLEKIGQNLRYFESFKIFELGKIYMPLSNKELPCESKMICGAVVDQEVESQKLFYQAKGTVELLLDKLNIEDYSFKVFESGGFGFQPYFHLNRTAKVIKDSDFIGTIFEVSSKTLTKFDIQARVAVFSLSFDVLSKLTTTKKIFKKIPKYPSITLDLSFILAKKVLHDQIKNAIIKAGRPLVKGVELFDVYQGKPLEKDEKSLAFHIKYQAEDRTLKDEEVKIIQDKIIETLERKFRAKIRKG
jgi:phenylalanyl-tRNA synthetase beta chain